MNALPSTTTILFLVSEYGSARAEAAKFRAYRDSVAPKSEEFAMHHALVKSWNAEADALYARIESALEGATP